MVKKVFFACVSILMLVGMKGFIYRSISQFFYLNTQKTDRAAGIVMNAKLNDGITARTYDCSYYYIVSETRYQVVETVSVDSITNYHPNDSIWVRYNVKKPWIASAGKETHRSFNCYISVAIIILSVYSLVSLVIMLIVRFRRQRIP